MTTPILENELSTGLVIAGAYADKLRRTLFAQLREHVRKNREVAREIARAAGEINRLLYYILVEELKSSKGDVVRIRVKYSFNPETMEIKWKYDTLKVEYFKRVPDEKVTSIVEKVISEKLAEVKEEYKAPPVSPAKTEEEWASEQTIGIAEGTRPLEKPREKPVHEAHLTAESLVGKVARIEPLGQTLHGSMLFGLIDEKGGSMGIASIEEVAGTHYVEAIIIHEGKAYKTRIKAGGSPQEYIKQPEKLLEELKESKLVEITREEAQQIIESKMEELA